MDVLFQVNTCTLLPVRRATGTISVKWFGSFCAMQCSKCIVAIHRYSVRFCGIVAEYCSLIAYRSWMSFGTNQCNQKLITKSYNWCWSTICAGILPIENNRWPRRRRRQRNVHETKHQKQENGKVKNEEERKSKIMSATTTAKTDYEPHDENVKWVWFYVSILLYDIVFYVNFLFLLFSLVSFSSNKDLEQSTHNTNWRSFHGIFVAFVWLLLDATHYSLFEVRNNTHKRTTDMGRRRRHTERITETLRLHSSRN